MAELKTQGKSIGIQTSIFDCQPLGQIYAKRRPYKTEPDLQIFYLRNSMCSNHFAQRVSGIAGVDEEASQAGQRMVLHRISFGNLIVEKILP